MRRLALLAAAVPVLSGLVVLGAPAPSGATTLSVAVTVDVAAARHSISPLIYGMNSAQPAVATSVHLPVNRWGGNATERYNWQAGSTNLANDYFFENVADCFTAAQNYCGNADHTTYRAWQARVDSDKAVKAATVMTVPAAGWVSKVPTYGHPLDCSYPASSTTSASYDPYDTACGDNLTAGGQWVSGAAPDRTSIPEVDETHVGAWVDALVARRGDAAHGGVGYYEPGNEPTLWSSTHHDIRDVPLTDAQQWDRQSKVAAVVKEHDPTAKVIGPSDRGWTGYLCSDADSAGGKCDATTVDRAAHNGEEHAAWWLDQAKGWEIAHSQRLVDFFDEHYYPAAQTGPDETRSLWDPTYTDPSWIGTTIRLIPRMHAWVNAHYPGTKLSIGEYDFWHHTEALGAVLEADALGIFGREQVDMAMLWGSLAPTDAATWAFRMYRNVDGTGRAFGSTSVSAISANRNAIASYAAQRADGSTTVMLVNKTSAAVTVPLTIRNYRDSSVRGFSYGASTAKGLSGIVAGPLGFERNGAVTTTVPAMGMVLLDVSGKVEQPLLATAVAAPATAPRNSAQVVHANLTNKEGPTAAHPAISAAFPVGTRVRSASMGTGWTCTTTVSSTKAPTVRCSAASLAAAHGVTATISIYEPPSGASAVVTVSGRADVVAQPVAATRATTKLS